MRKFLSRVKNKLLVAGTAAVTAASLAVAASAEGEISDLASAADQITAQFTNAANDITPIILGVLGAGLGIFIIFVGIKLAKRMFSTVSKG